jgi:hypothetical protein
MLAVSHLSPAPTSKKLPELAAEGFVLKPMVALCDKPHASSIARIGNAKNLVAMVVRLVLPSLYNHADSSLLLIPTIPSLTCRFNSVKIF